MTGDKAKKGFTLVEMLVSAFVFSVVFGAATGILVSSMRIQKFNLSHQQLMDQASYAAEYMVRSIRMAQKNNPAFGGAQSYQLTANGIRFFDYQGRQTDFYLDGATSQLMISGGPLSAPAPLISDDYEVVNLSFVVLGDNPAGDDLQPRVTFFMEVQDSSLPDKPKIKLQTTVSQRNLDSE